MALTTVTVDERADGRGFQDVTLDTDVAAALDFDLQGYAEFLLGEERRIANPYPPIGPAVSYSG